MPLWVTWVTLAFFYISRCRMVPMVEVKYPTNADEVPFRTFEVLAEIVRQLVVANKLEVTYGRFMVGRDASGPSSSVTRRQQAIQALNQIEKEI